MSARGCRSTTPGVPVRSAPSCTCSNGPPTPTSRRIPDPAHRRPCPGAGRRRRHRVLTHQHRLTHLQHRALLARLQPMARSAAGGPPCRRSRRHRRRSRRRPPAAGDPFGDYIGSAARSGRWRSFSASTASTSATTRRRIEVVKWVAGDPQRGWRPPKPAAPISTVARLASSTSRPPAAESAVEDLHRRWTGGANDRRGPRTTASGGSQSCVPAIDPSSP